MFDSFKDKFRSVVQDGINLNKTVREKILQAHNHTVRSSKAVNKDIPDKINPAAGSSILEKYQKEWMDIHDMSEKCAREAELVDNYMTNIHLGIAKRLQDITQINSMLSSLPKVIADVQDCVSNLKVLTQKFNEVEEELMNLEFIVDRGDFEQRKLEHTFQLSMYKEKKLVALENCRISLGAKQSEVLREADKKHREYLKEKQLAASMAFQEDLNLYKTQGELPKKITLSKDKVKEVTLEEIQLTSEDTTELDKFLNED